MRYPAVRVRLVGQNSAETAAAIQAGEIEAGMLILPVDDEICGPAAVARRGVLRQRRPARTAEPVTIQQFAAATWCCTTRTTGGRTRPAASSPNVRSWPGCGWNR